VADLEEEPTGARRTPLFWVKKEEITEEGKAGIA